MVWITLYSKCNAKLILTKWFLIIHPGAYFFWFEETLRNILWVFAWESNALKLIRTFKKKEKKNLQWRLRFYFFSIKNMKKANPRLSNRSYFTSLSLLNRITFQLEFIRWGNEKYCRLSSFCILNYRKEGIWYIMKNVQH